ncbi:CENP-B N-terminal DNA-binding domain [Popillia japonica]|uniref:CENP-B N-terminal DNA-binding domain n=1 Tax=Popillia japonica TaxID=7064 RepID=A0AAW1JJF3_POPJA
MMRAVKAVRNREMGYKNAAKYLEVPKGTLERYVKNFEKTAESLVNVRMGRKPINVRMGRKPTLPQHLEDLLVKYCVEMDSRFYGVNVRMGRKPVNVRMGRKPTLPQHLEDLLVKYCVEMDSRQQCAGDKWLRRFLRRHTQLSLKKPQGTSFARVKGFNPENVKRFFEIYEPELLKINSQPHRLYNVDETGVTIVQHKFGHEKTCKWASYHGGNVHECIRLLRPSIDSLATKKHARWLDGWDSLRINRCMPSIRLDPNRHFYNVVQPVSKVDGTPSGSIAACHPSGWIQTDIFTMWFNQFLKHVKPSQDDPVLLLLDGHNSHTRNMDVIDKAREHHVSIICLPPHSSHKMQPLDVSFMFPLKTFYAQAIEDWLHSSPGKVVTNFKVGRLFGIAYNRAATMNNSINGFKKTGLFPLNKNAFGDEDFPIHTHNSVSSEAVDAITPTGSPQPCSSSDNVEQEINPLPTLVKNDPSKPTRARKAEIITSTPYKNKLAESINKKAPASLKKTLFSTGNKRVGKGAPTGKGEMVENTPLVKIRRKNKPNYNDDDLSSIEDDERLSPHDNSDDSIDDNDAECLFCGSLFSEDKGGEQWRQCIIYSCEIVVS